MTANMLYCTLMATHFVEESILSFMGSLYTKMPHPTEEWTGPLG